MYLTVKQQLNRLTKEEYLILRELSHIAKNLTNEMLYTIRQYYFTEKKYLSYSKAYKTIKDSENYKMLNSNMAQNIMMSVDESFKSFFQLLKLKEKGRYDKKVHIPHYLDKDGFATLIIGFVRINDSILEIPFSNKYRKTHERIGIKIPPILKDKTIKEIRIMPKYKARFFEIQYTYEIKEKELNKNTNHVLAIDLGVNNLVTCVTNKGKSFIIDGKKLKSINQYYNKRNSRLQCLNNKKDIKEYSKQQYQILNKRNNRVNDYISKAAKLIINYSINNNIDTIIIGKNNNFQSNINLGKANNQNFAFLPLGKLAFKLKYLCQLYGIRYIEQEESYTSKASFFDNDDIPIYDKNNKNKYIFSGKRIKRGLYKTSNGKLLNADVNGALNILKKSKVVDLTILYHRGEVDTPLRIKII